MDHNEVLIWEWVVKDVWNYFADGFNMWDSLGSDEKDMLLAHQSVGQLIQNLMDMEEK